MRLEAVLHYSGPCHASADIKKTLQVAVDLMRAEATDAILVTDHCATEGQAVFGLLTREHVIDAIATYGMAAFAMPVFKFAKGRLVVCDKGELLSDVVALMKQRSAFHALVMDREQAIGLVAVSDILFFNHGAMAAAESVRLN